MTHHELKQARLELGLTPRQAAAVLETSIDTIRRIERDPDCSTARKAPERIAQLYRAYQSGFRPANWPQPRDLTPHGKRERQLTGEDGHVQGR